MSAVMPGLVRSSRFAQARYGFGFRRYGLAFFFAGGRLPGALGSACVIVAARGLTTPGQRR